MFDTNLQVFSLVAPYVWRKGSHLFLFLKNTLNFSRYIKLCIQHIFHTFVKFEYAVFVVYIVNTYFSEIWGEHDVRAVWVDTFLINKFSTIKLSSPTCDKKDDLLSWLYSSSLLHVLDLLWLRGLILLCLIDMLNWLEWVIRILLRLRHTCLLEHLERDWKKKIHQARRARTVGHQVPCFSDWGHWSLLC